MEYLLLKVNTEFVGLEEVFCLLNYEVDESNCFMLLIFAFKCPTTFLKYNTVYLNLFLSIFYIMSSVIPVAWNLPNQNSLVPRCLLADMFKYWYED